MNKLKKTILTIFLISFTACGSSEESINPNLGFDMWEYMTSNRNYEVEYSVYENNQFSDYYKEEHFQYGDKYVRDSSAGQTQILLNSNHMLMIEPNNQITIDRYVNIGDQGIFQANNIKLCKFSRFYEEYQMKGKTFDNVIQIECNYHSGIYQETYYGFNEGIVSIYEENNGLITEYVKTNEQRI